MTLVPFTENHAPAHVAPDVRTGGLSMLPTYVELIREIADTDFIPEAMRRKPGAILACFMKGYELGLGPMQALDSIDVIKGRPGLKPEAMRGLIVQTGHSISIPENTAEAVTIRVHRKEWPADVWEEFRWTMVDAKTAGLTSNPSWQKYPRAMLLARVTSEAARAHFADVIKGLSYTPDEIEAFDGPPVRAARRETLERAALGPAQQTTAPTASKPSGSVRRPPPSKPKVTEEPKAEKVPPADPAFDLAEPVASIGLRCKNLTPEQLAEYTAFKNEQHLPSSKSVDGWTTDLVALAVGMLDEIEGPK